MKGSSEEECVGFFLQFPVKSLTEDRKKTHNQSVVVAYMTEASFMSTLKSKLCYTVSVACL